jgi:iron complex transport system ATP-binding protein
MTNAPPHPRLSCRGLTVSVPGRTLCRGFDVDVNAGEMWVVVGPNGAGKTMLLSTLAGLRAPVEGDIAYDGAPLRMLSTRQRALCRGWLPQDTVDHFPATVLETVLVGRHPHLSRWQWESSVDVDRARHALADVGLAGFETRAIGSLSGGERRRVAVAALLVQEPPLLLLDEPSSHLDLAHQIETLEVVVRLAHERHAAVVMVLHELHLALRYADHAIAMGHGQAKADEADKLLTASSLSTLFGHPLLEVGEGRVRTVIPA